MKTFLPFIILPLIISCAPVASPVPTTSSAPTSTLTPFVSKQAVTSTRTPIPATPAITNPYTLPTAINTPHMVPTMIGQITYQQGLRLYDKRVSAFDGTLRFSIKISDVQINYYGDLVQYLIIADGQLTNVSNKPIVIRRTLSTGFTNNEDVTWKLFYGNTELAHTICCIDAFGGPFLSPEEYVTLQPGEFQNYRLPFELPLKVHAIEGNEVLLSGKTITLVATYYNSRVGYEKVSPSSNKYIDMNSWVGRVQSNSVEYTFP